MRIFGSDRMDGMLQKLGLKEDEAIVHPWINKALERAQGKVEAHNFDIRKNLLKFDNVMNDQRKVIFEQRIELMSDEHAGETVRDMRHEVVDEIVAKFIPERAYAEQWDVAGPVGGGEGAARPRPAGQGMGGRGRHRRRGDPRAHRQGQRRADGARRRRASGRSSCAPSRSRCCCRRSTICGASISRRSTTCARSIGFRGYAQRDPLNEYKTEGFELFQTLLANLRRAVTGQLAHVEIQQRPPEPPPPLVDARRITSTPRPARTRWRRPTPRLARAAASGARRSATRRIPRPGARSAATSPAPAARARNTSSATGW